MSKNQSPTDFAIDECGRTRGWSLVRAASPGRAISRITFSKVRAESLQEKNLARGERKVGAGLFLEVKRPPGE